MVSTAGPCLYCHGGVSQTLPIPQFRIAATGGGSEEDGDTSIKERRGKSAQLQRWARARRIRSGRTILEAKNNSPVSNTEAPVKEAQAVAVGIPDHFDNDSDDSDESSDAKHKNGREVYMISDGTGWTADHAVQAALGQFENCFVDQRCSVDTHLFSQVVFRPNIRVSVHLFSIIRVPNSKCSLFHL